MYNKSSNYLSTVIRELSKLPGIGPKSASRLAFHILTIPVDDVETLANSLIELKKNISKCSICGGISDEDICSICKDNTKNRDIICVVENARDVLTIESTGEFNGIYHVLEGVISPLDGIGPEELNLHSLLDRCKNENFEEVILALNPTIEGDATILYISKLFEPLDIKVTKIAYGLPVGADLEFIDSATISKSIEGRMKI